jgi:aerobic C4-dicarboxylate transport protein
MSEARALMNFIGNAVVTLVVAKWINELDQPRMRRVLDNETPEEADEPEKVFDRTDERMPIATAGPRSHNI